MTKICQQILFTLENFEFLREEQAGRKHKNLSQTLNELLKNYQFMVNSVDRKQQEIERKNQAEKEYNKLIDNYRQQIIKV